MLDCLILMANCTVEFHWWITQPDFSSECFRGLRNTAGRCPFLFELENKEPLVQNPSSLALATRTGSGSQDLMTSDLSIPWTQGSFWLEMAGICLATGRLELGLLYLSDYQDVLDRRSTQNIKANSSQLAARRGNKSKIYIKAIYFSGQLRSAKLYQDFQLVKNIGFVTSLSYLFL